MHRMHTTHMVLNIQFRFTSKVSLIQIAQYLFLPECTIMVQQLMKTVILHHLLIFPLFLSLSLWYAPSIQHPWDDDRRETKTTASESGKRFIQLSASGRLWFRLACLFVNNRGDGWKYNHGNIICIWKWSHKGNKCWLHNERWPVG